MARFSFNHGMMVQAPRSMALIANALRDAGHDLFAVSDGLSSGSLAGFLETNGFPNMEIIGRQDLLAPNHVDRGSLLDKNEIDAHFDDRSEVANMTQAEVFTGVKAGAVYGVVVGRNRRR